MLSLAAADDLTQRRPNPYFLRASATSSQAMHPMGHYAATEMKLKRVITIVEDFAFGRQMGGFQAVFQQDGGCIVNKLRPPIVTPDYTPYLAQITDCDGVCQGFAGSNPLRLMKQSTWVSSTRCVPERPEATTRCCAVLVTRRSA